MSICKDDGNIPRLPLLNRPFQLLVFTETLTTTNELPKGHLIVAIVPLTIASAHTKSFLKTVVVIELKFFFFISKHLPNNFIVFQQRLKIRHFLLYPSTTLNKLKFHGTN